MPSLITQFVEVDVEVIDLTMAENEINSEVLVTNVDIPTSNVGISDTVDSEKLLNSANDGMNPKSNELKPCILRTTSFKKSAASKSKVSPKKKSVNSKHCAGYPSSKKKADANSSGSVNGKKTIPDYFRFTKVNL